MLTEIEVTMKSLLDEAIVAWNVPGAQLCVVDGNETSLACAGVANVETGQQVTPNTVFKIGSIMKTVTAVAAMTLVDDGAISLNDRIQDHLPNFQLGDRHVAETLTLHQLLSHTGGFDGDFFLNNGQDDRALERYVAACHELQQFFQPGTQHAYNNAGFCILGRVLEVVAGSSFDTIVKAAVQNPCAMTGFVAGHHDPALYNMIHAVGHDSVSGVHRPIVDTEPRALSPAGSSGYGRALDLARLGCMLRDKGQGHLSRALSPASVEAMSQQVIEGPSETFADGWGLGLMLFDWQGHHLFGHDGAVPGQNAVLRVDQESGLVVTLVSNGGVADGFAQDVLSNIFGPLAGIRPKTPPTESATAIADLSGLTGTYGDRAQTIRVEVEAGELKAISEPTYEGKAGAPPFEVALRPVDRARMLARFEGAAFDRIQRFLEFDTRGQANAINFRGRYYPRKTISGSGP